jgi:Asp-tRNA(Asn)/Glu-tRNA(Gln) amidotransferase A subunit family amidase
VIRAVLAPAAQISGVEVFRGVERLAVLRREADRVFADIDVLALPTVPTTYRIESMLADPVRLNSRLGTYTMFTNLLDLAAVAVPAGFAAGLPFGLTLAAPAGADGVLACVAAEFHAHTGLDAGAGVHPLAAGSGNRSPSRDVEKSIDATSA